MENKENFPRSNNTELSGVKFPLIDSTAIETNGGSTPFLGSVRAERALNARFFFFFVFSQRSRELQISLSFSTGRDSGEAVHLRTPRVGTVTGKHRVRPVFFQKKIKKYARYIADRIRLFTKLNIFFNGFRASIIRSAFEFVRRCRREILFGNLSSALENLAQQGLGGDLFASVQIPVQRSNARRHGPS